MRMKYVAHFISEDGKRTRRYPLATQEPDTREFVDGATRFVLNAVHHIPELSPAEQIDAARVRAW